MKEIAYIGIDPGAKGQYCLLVPEEGRIHFAPTTDKPLFTFSWINDIREEYNLRIIMIEDVRVIPGSAATSSFNFGYNVGVVNAISSASGMGVDRVKPRAWQKHIGLVTPQAYKGAARKKKIKTGVAEICERLYPQADIYGPRGGLHDGKSDSLMIAHYAYHKYNQVK